MNCERATLSGACRYQVYGRSSVVLALLVTAAALFFSVSAFAQGTTGTLRGQVLDPAGAVVPNAEVTVTNQETGVSVKVTTTSAGTNRKSTRLNSCHGYISYAVFCLKKKNDLPTRAAGSSTTAPWPISTR